MVRRTPLLVLVTVLALVLAACGGGDKSTVDLPGGGQAEIGGEDGGITIEGPSGTVQIGQAELPDGWPGDFPLPDDAEPVYSVAAEGGVSVWFATAQSTEDLTAFFTEALPAAAATEYTGSAAAGSGMEGGVYLGGSAAGTAPGFEGEFDFWVTLSPAS